MKKEFFTPRKLSATLAFIALIMVAPCANAQSLNSLVKKAQNAANSLSNGTTVTTTSKTTAGIGSPNESGTIYYVSSAGSARADGLSASAPMKDLQKAINKIKDNGENGATIRIAEGNYLGAMDAGYIEISNWITLEGGWNASFTERNPMKYITRMEPTQAQLGTNTSKGMVTLSKLDNTNYTVGGTITIDGIMFNMGLENNYKPNDPSDPKNGCPSTAFETGRLLDDPQSQPQHQIIHSEGAVAGNLIIRNCLFANGVYFGIQISSRCGEIEIANCVFVCNRMSAVRIDGWDKDGTHSRVSFHHNTVAFSWCRDKLMEDMGYGYECMNKVSCDLHHNIFLCNNYAAIARTHALSGPDAVIEARKVTNVYDNYFFMNAADLQLPSKGGGKWTNVPCSRFEEVDESILPKYENNFELKSGDAFIQVIDKDYLEAFANLKSVRSASFDANSAANQYRQAHGLNMQGTETIRVSMYGNRYNFEKCLLFFGAKEGYGAQLIK